MLTLLLTNDDGIDAPSLRALFEACGDFARCVVVAPKEPASGVGHQCTTHASIAVTRRAENWFAVDGTPVDCTRIALTEIAPDVDWVISGINRGGNLGADSYISGTLAAAREAALLGRAAVAVSQYIVARRELDWATSGRRARSVLEQLFAGPDRAPCLLNVNLPHLLRDAPPPEVVFCGLDPGPLNVSYRVSGSMDDDTFEAVYDGSYHGRSRHPGRDVDVCFGGQIAVTRIPVDLTGDV